MARRTNKNCRIRQTMDNSQHIHSKSAAERPSMIVSDKHTHGFNFVSLCYIVFHLHGFKKFHCISLYFIWFHFVSLCSIVFHLHGFNICFVGKAFSVWKAIIGWRSSVNRIPINLLHFLNNNNDNNNTNNKTNDDDNKQKINNFNTVIKMTWSHWIKFVWAKKCWMDTYWKSKGTESKIRIWGWYDPIETSPFLA